MNAPVSATKPQIVVYRAADAPPLTEFTMSRGPLRPADEAGYAEAAKVGLRDSAVIRLLFEDERAGVSLTYAWFKAGAMVPRHSHSADCLYYMISGSVSFGSEELGPGDGFLVPANTLYSLEAGGSGVELLEFRTKTKFDVSFAGTEASWKRIVEKLKVVQPTWTSMEVPPAARRMLATGN
jgi:quercetin dioxygenase-like cupin family protein